MSDREQALRELYEIPDEKYIRFITTEKDRVEFIYLSGYSSIEDGWLAWGDLVSSHSFNGIDVDERIRSELEHCYAAQGRLYKKIAMLEQSGEYKAAYISDLSVIAVKNEAKSDQ